MTTQKWIEYLQKFDPNSKLKMLVLNPKTRKKYIGSLVIITDMECPVIGYEVEQEVDFSEEEVAAAEQDEARDGWILCSEGLPKAEYGESDTVYCTIRNTETGDRRCKKLYFDGSCWCYPTGEVFNCEWRVIAWQPLPEPYEGD